MMARVTRGSGGGGRQGGGRGHAERGVGLAEHPKRSELRPYVGRAVGPRLLGQELLLEEKWIDAHDLGVPRGHNLGLLPVPRRVPPRRRIGPALPGNNSVRRISAAGPRRRISSRCFAAARDATRITRALAASPSAVSAGPHFVLDGSRRSVGGSDAAEKGVEVLRKSPMILKSV